MPLYNDYHELMQRQKTAQEQATRTEHARLIPRISDITHKAQIVVDHPGWQFFLDTLETRVQSLEQSRLALITQMVGGAALGQDLERLKISMNRLDSELAGIKYAASLIPQAVTLGQKIAGDAGQRATAARADT